MQKDLLHLFPLMSPSQSVKRGKAGGLFHDHRRHGWKDTTRPVKKQTKEQAK